MDILTALALLERGMLSLGRLAAAIKTARSEGRDELTAAELSEFRQRDDASRKKLEEAIAAAEAREANKKSEQPG